MILAGDVGGTKVHLSLYSFEEGLHSAYLPVAGGSDATVVIQSVDGDLPCIGDAQAGVLLPSEARPAIPPLAVAG